MDALGFAQGYVTQGSGPEIEAFASVGMGSAFSVHATRQSMAFIAHLTTPSGLTSANVRFGAVSILAFRLADGLFAVSALPALIAIAFEGIRAATILTAG